MAVDNASGDFYVADTFHEVIDKFDASGALIESFGDTTPTPNGQLAGTATPDKSFLHPGTETPLSITVDQSTHDLYVIDSGHKVIDVFDENGEYLPLKQITEAPGGLYGCEGFYTDGIAVNATSGHVLVSDSCPPAQTYEFDNTGAFVKALDGSNTPAGFFSAVHLGGDRQQLRADLHHGHRQ